jgi:haloalkane dehalogenase
MWGAVVPHVEAAGWTAEVPDLSAAGTWGDGIAVLDALVAERDLPPAAVVVHDWGGLIGLRWACDNPDRVRALVISAAGFFPDGKWHDFAIALRTPEVGEQVIENVTYELFQQMLTGASDSIGDEAIQEYFAVSFGTPEAREATLKLYRSGDFEKLEPYRGKLAALGVPTLCIWGADDAFAPPKSAHRLAEEIPGTRVEVLEGAGHFVWEDAPDRAGELLASFLRTV